MSDISSLSEAPAGPGRRARPPALALGCLLGAVAAAVGLLVVIAITGRDPLPRLTRETLDAAIARWQQAGPANYDLDLVLTGAQTGNLHIEVRDGEFWQRLHLLTKYSTRRYVPRTMPYHSMCRRGQNRTPKSVQSASSQTPLAANSFCSAPCGINSTRCRSTSAPNCCK